MRQIEAKDTSEGMIVYDCDCPGMMTAFKIIKIDFESNTLITELVNDSFGYLKDDDGYVCFPLSHVSPFYVFEF